MSEKGTTIRTNYDYRNLNGGGIWLPPNPGVGLNNIARPNYNVQDTVQKYPIGTLARLGVRQFVYCKAGGTLRGIARLLADGNYIPGASGQEDATGFEGQLYQAQAAGDYSVIIEDGTDRVVNYYQDGYFTVFNADGVKTFTTRIAASDVATSVDNVTLYLDDPLPWAVVEHDWCDAYRSPYSAVTEAAAGGFESFVGLAHCAVTSAYWFWAQVAGPCWLAQSASTILPGYTQYYRDVYAWIDGTVRVGATAGVLQRVGYSLGRSVATTGDTYTMLQLI